MLIRKDDIRLLQVELTSACNAACPQCARTGNSLLPIAETNYEDFIQWFEPEFAKQLSKVLYCGNYGDPAMENDLPKILEYFVSCNSNTRNSVNTNGSLRSKDWWKDIGNILNKSVTSNVTFCIDGLEDTNHLYRINTDWNKIIENAEAYISTGATATWVFIVFEHNEHQIDEARELSQKLGFKQFAIKGSHRTGTVKPLNKIRKDQQYVVDNLNINKSTQEKYLHPIFKKEKKETNSNIFCDAKIKSSVYIDFAGDAWPCVWMGLRKYQNSKAGRLFRDTLKNWDVNYNNLRNHSLECILNNEFFSYVEKTWAYQEKLDVCVKYCSEPVNLCDQQFLERYNNESRGGSNRKP